MAGEEVMTEEMAGEEETADMIAVIEVTMVETGVIMVETMAETAVDMEEAAVINRYYQ